MTERGEQAVLRDAMGTDLPFIYRSILMGTYFGNKPAKGLKLDPKSSVDYFGAINQDTFMHHFHHYLDHLFTHPGLVIKVACLQSDKDVILGFSVSKGSSLHFVFVKPDWRGIGLARDLTPTGITSVSGFTRVGDIIRRKRGWEFNPWG